MNRAVIAVAGLACLGAGIGPAFAVADGPVNEGRTASTSFGISLASGETFTVELRAVQGSGAPQWLLDVSDCSSRVCGKSYAGTLPGSALTIDSTSTVAKLTTTLSGLPLTVSWKPSAQSLPAESLQAHSDNSGSTAASGDAGSSADVTVQLADQSCNTGGDVGNGASVDGSAATGAPEDAPVSAFDLPDGAVLSCS